jgi:hypothetical protein
MLGLYEQRSVAKAPRNRVAQSEYPRSVNLRQGMPVAVIELLVNLRL